MSEQTNETAAKLDELIAEQKRTNELLEALLRKTPDPAFTAVALRTLERSMC
ncbi:MAG TPA: hypothetical protein VJ654_14195 [Noviherbaspirillum sp.]|nr:hypothetical protein [Noviherbaspirillum sp.]